MLDKKALKYYRTLRIPAKISKISKYMYLSIILIILTVYTLFQQSVHIKISILLLHILAWVSLPLLIKMLIGYIKVRQCINMSLFLLLLGIPLEIAGFFMKIPGLMYIAIPLLGILSIRAFTNSRTKSLIIILYVFIIEFLFAMFIDLFELAIWSRAALLLISIAVSVYFVETLARKNGVNVYGIANSWIKTMLLNSEEDFARLLDSIGLEVQVNTHLLLFKTRTRDILLLVPEIHFGPFKNVGSSSLPYIIDKIFSSANTITFVFHSAGSHERNLVSTDESWRYGEAIFNEVVFKRNFIEDVVYEPFRVYDNQFEAFVLQTNSLSLIIISLPTIGNDDIPYQVQVKAVELGKMYGFYDVAIVDAHNVEGEAVNDPDKYTNIIVAALSKSSRLCTNFGIGYGEAIAKGYVKGLCSNKVKALSIKCNNSIYGLVYLYSNNAKMGVREILRRIAINMGYKDIEVVTADDHSCSGITYDAPYQVVEYNVHLLKAVEQALAISKNSITECKIYTSRATTKNKVVGMKIFELLELAKDLSQRILRYILTSFLLIYVLAAFLVLIITYA